MNIGKKIHKLRKEKDMSLVELSKKSGVAIATLSRMENNKMPGTVGAHECICKALNVSIVELYCDFEDNAKAVPKTRQTEHFDYTCKARYELLARNTNNKKILPLMIRLGAGGETPEEVNKPGVEKFICVIAGTLEIVVGGKVVILKRGDSLYFDASLAHVFKNDGKAEVRALCVVSLD